jgi:hypothetical protein
MPISTIGQAGLNAPITLTSPTLTTPNIDSAQFATVSGTAPLYACRAWVNFNGTGTVAIRASGNVSSITDSGTGTYSVNYTTAMPDVNYSIVSCARDSGVAVAFTSNAASSASAGFVQTLNTLGTTYDVNQINVAIFR